MTALSDFPFYDVKFEEGGKDELKVALDGIKQVQNDKSGDSDDFMVLQPNFWPSNDAMDSFEFKSDILVPEIVVDINGEFTEDLDLFFTADDVRNLFSYVKKDYKTICGHALQALKAQKAEDADKLKEESDKLLDHEYNYLSENENARKSLYQVCILDDNISPEE